MRIYKVIFNKGKENKIFNSEKSAREYCKQFFETKSRYSYEYDRYIEETNSINGGCCLITMEV